MHPNTLILSLAALASVVVSTNDKDHGSRCQGDEYYNKMMESKNRKTAITDCAKWLSGTITDAQEIPKYLKDCAGDKDRERVSRVSAACSCISTSSVPTTLSTRTQVSSTPSSTVVVTTSSRPSSHQPSSSWTPIYSIPKTFQQPSAFKTLRFDLLELYNHLSPAFNFFEFHGYILHYQATIVAFFCSAFIYCINYCRSSIYHADEPFQSSAFITFEHQGHDVLNHWAADHTVSWPYPYHILNP
ncbi:hypothetical protein F5883DRAFT_653012 [Diaporthe sp. PMI_573]|nr:hypothetical protein F5883DRAFT_653012 [Diaporthaceae sp. PMI_573]